MEMFCHSQAVLILLLLWLATGSMRLALVALVPNILPVFLVLALVGFTGGKINMGAAMIAAVSVGLSIDGSVHFLAGYQRTRLRKHTAQTSSRHAAGRTGVPILLATAALMVGFGVMSTSDFVPTATFGALVASTLGHRNHRELDFAARFCRLGITSRFGLNATGPGKRNASVDLTAVTELSACRHAIAIECAASISGNILPNQLAEHDCIFHI